MSESEARPSIFWAVLFLLLTIAVGAHLSAIPLIMVKIAVAVVLAAIYAFFAVRIVGAMRISAKGLRAIVGLLLAVATLYATWAIRIPAFSGWETAFTADPVLILDAIVDRANSMQVSRGFGHGTTTEGPSWLMLGTYAFEALAICGIMTLGALLAFPDKKKATEAEVDEPARLAA